MKGSFPISNSGLAAAQAELARWLQDRGVGQATIRRAAVILDEICANMIRHDESLGSDDVFDVEATQAEVVRLKISDPGKPFDPVSHQGISNDDLGGHGISIIKAMSLEVGYQHADGRNCLEITLALTD